MHNGYRAIDKGADYEKKIQGLYDDLQPTGFKVELDGVTQNRIADAVTEIGDDLVAVEAKFVDDWNKSLRNPLDINPWAINAQQEMLEQARAYSSYFNKVIYHSNSQDLINHYSKVFNQNGISNIEWILTSL